MRLVLICDPKGVPAGYDLVGPKTGEERECALRLAAGQTPDKHRPGKRPSAEVAKARIRLVIESVFSTFKRQMRLEVHLAKTVARARSTDRQRLPALKDTVGVATL